MFMVQDSRLPALRDLDRRHWCSWSDMQDMCHLGSKRFISPPVVFVVWFAGYGSSRLYAIYFAASTFHGWSTNRWHLGSTRFISLPRTTYSVSRLHLMNYIPVEVIYLKMLWWWRLMTHEAVYKCKCTVVYTSVSYAHVLDGLQSQSTRNMHVAIQMIAWPST